VDVRVFVCVMRAIAELVELFVVLQQYSSSTVVAGFVAAFVVCCWSEVLLSHEYSL
jgi:uncharacterized membrane protein YjjB (DUF3815 family)